MDERFLVCDERDWSGMTADQRDFMIFKTLRSMDERLQSLERWNKALSFAGGMIGGALAAIGIRLI